MTVSCAVMDNRSRAMDKHMDSRERAAHMLIHSPAGEGALIITSALETAIVHSLHSCYYYI